MSYELQRKNFPSVKDLLRHDLLLVETKAKRWAHQSESKMCC